MAANDELGELLGGGELAAFHGKPADAVGVLERAVVLAQSQGRGAEVAAAAWLLGVALAAGGRYGGALTVLSPLAESGGAAGAPPERRLFAALAGATIASVHRQLGRHGVAREADRGALSLTDGTGEAAFDALLGLASGAVGLDDGEEAAARLAAAAAGRARVGGGAVGGGAVGGGAVGGGAVAGGAVPGDEDRWWRQRVRLGWVAAEVSMLACDVDEAAARARDAVEGQSVPAHPGTWRRAC